MSIEEDLGFIISLISLEMVPKLGNSLKMIILLSSIESQGERSLSAILVEVISLDVVSPDYWLVLSLEVFGDLDWFHFGVIELLKLWLILGPVGQQQAMSSVELKFDGLSSQIILRFS